MQQESQQESRMFFGLPKYDEYWEAKSLWRAIVLMGKNQRQTKICRWVGRIGFGLVISATLLLASQRWLGGIDIRAIVAIAATWAIVALKTSND